MHRGLFRNFALLLGVFLVLWLGIRFLLPIGLPFLLGTLLAFAAEPAVSLLSGLLAKSWLKAGLPCAFAASLMAFFLTDAFHCLLALFAGGGMGTALWLAARETAASLPFLIPVYLIFRKIYAICHVYD